MLILKNMTLLNDVKSTNPIDQPLPGIYQGEPELNTKISPIGPTPGLVPIEY